MEGIEIPKPGPIKVIREPKYFRVKIKLPANTAPHPPDYDLFWMLADVYVVEEDKEEGYFLKDVQVASFGEGNPLEMEVDIPEYILTRPKLKPTLLVLLYYDKGDEKWKPFENQELDLEKKLCRISFTDWIRDPPVGWGGYESK